MVEKQGYSFEVESDYCDWEVAVTGLAALREQLAKLGADKVPETVDDWEREKNLESRFTFYVSRLIETLHLVENGP